MRLLNILLVSILKQSRECRRKRTVLLESK